MSCECHQIGGRFIAEDPDCAEHGYQAQAREESREATAVYQMQGRDDRWRDITKEEFYSETFLKVRKLFTE